MRPHVAAVAGGALLLTSLLLGQPLEGLAQAEPPPPLGEASISFPDFEEFTLDNGLRVVVLSYGTQPVMSARLYLPGGRSLEPADRAGLAGLTATVLTRGTETRSAPEISEIIEDVGGSLNASAGQDWLSVSTVVLTEHAEVAFDLLEDVVLRANFPDDEVELARRQTLSALQAELGQPQAIAQRHFSAMVYGDDHPYGVSATPSTVNTIAREDMVDFHDRLFQPDGALLLVAGRVERDRIEELARRHFGHWAPGERVEVDLQPAPERTDTRILLVNRPGSVQSVIAVGHLALEPHDPDYFAATVMNRVLGGGSDARLFRILREEKGWTYGAYSQLTRPAHRGVFRAITEARTEVTDSALVEMVSQLERLRNEPVPADELDGARNFLAGSFPLRLETADQVAGQLASTLLLDLPLEDLTGYPERIRRIQAEDVQEAARSSLHPGRAAIVVVGDGAQLLERLEAIAPVDIVDVEGNPLGREELVAATEPMEWDGARLEEGIRRYDVYIQGNPMGSAEYRLEREGDEWLSTSVVTAMGAQETRLRFSAQGLEPRSSEMDLGQLSMSLRVEDGRLVGSLNLPPQLGGDREVDEAMEPGLLLPGMEEFALAVSDLSEGARIGIPILNLIEDRRVTLEARVTGMEEISVPAGEFQVWRVELTGGEAPMILYLRAEAPHILIRQEYQGQPIRLDLTAVGPL
jgi:zinc protease